MLGMNMYSNISASYNYYYILTIYFSASSSSERTLERRRRRLAGKKSLEKPMTAYHQPPPQSNDHSHREHRSQDDPRYLPLPLMMHPQPYPMMYPYMYPPLGYVPYFLPYPDDVPAVLNVIKEEGSTQDSEVSLTVPPPTSPKKSPSNTDAPVGLDEFVLY